MATAAPTDNRVYLYRLLTLNIDHGTTIVRNLIDDRCSNTTLSTILAQERRAITNLRANRTITKVQFDLLYPQSGITPTTADFDLTLALCLLRTLKHFGLNPKYTWNVTPQPGDTSLEADLCRLRMYRNELAHISSTSGIQKQEFNDKWKDIEGVLHRLNCLVQTPVTNLQQIIDDCKNGPLDPEAEKKIEHQIEKMQKMEEKLEIEVKALTKNVHKIETDVHEAKRDVHTATEDVQKIRDEVHKVKENVHIITVDVHKIVDDVHEVKGDVHTVTEAVHEVKGDVHTVTEAVHEVKGDVHTVTEAVHEVKGDVHTVTEAVHEVKGDVHTVTEIVHEVKDDICTVTDEVRKLREDSRTTNERINELELKSKSEDGTGTKPEVQAEDAYIRRKEDKLYMPPP
ncbi:probable DNA double-strand break repair Rad50 ATPase [Mercenaria mercenaria]|uniref:probable DNA double-strand break repair Rad50 ATPase n=1 Tax=Mercenaria mercenaria TaxID=6596 RepID=UPI00234E38A8|nr:probable DNA double-strand break repair Rad50 ATPase [Mercenaria mercenaria]